MGLMEDLDIKESLMVAEKPNASIEAWEEGKLGQEEAHVAVSGAGAEKALDATLNLQLISIRLPKALIEDLKIIAKLNGIGYQPLIRQLLTRFVVAEKKQALLAALEQTKSQEKALAKEEAQAKEEKGKKAA